MRKQSTCYPAALLAGTLLTLLTGGCGGGARPSIPQSAGTGRASFVVKWPGSSSGTSRLVPAASSSIKVALRRGDTTLGERILLRPAEGGETPATFENLPIGDVVATASAHPDAEGSGTAQARGSVALTIEPDTTAQVRLTMGSTIERLQITSSAPSISLGGTVELTAAALDAAGSVVLTSGENWQWTVSDPAVVALTPNGDRATLQWLSEGTVTGTVTEMESGKSAQATVTLSGSTYPNP